VIVWEMDLQLPMHSEHITTKVGEVYLIQHYVLKFVSEMRPVCGKTCQNTRSVAQLNFAVLRLNVELCHDKVKWTNDFTWNY
jgi:hypothetical protein